MAPFKVSRALTSSYNVWNQINRDEHVLRMWFMWSTKVVKSAVAIFKLEDTYECIWVPWCATFKNYKLALLVLLIKYQRMFNFCIISKYSITTWFWEYMWSTWRKEGGGKINVIWIYLIKTLTFQHIVVKISRIEIGLYQVHSCREFADLV